MRKARNNPFCTKRVEQILRFDPELIGDSWAAIEKRWRTYDNKGVVLGNHGSGKTTFLYGFAEWLQEQGESVVILFFNDLKKTFNQAETDALRDIEKKIILVDGLECISAVRSWQLQRQLNKAKGQVIAKHKVLNQVRAKVIIELKPSEILAKQLLSRLTKEHYPEEEIRQDLVKHQGNLRHLWLEHYDRWANG